MVPQSVIEELLSRVSIAEVIGRVTEIRRSGRGILALCPFHHEKSPSFSISEEKGLYHCFGCGASGNTLKFLMDYHKMSFPEALEELAKIAGVDLSQYRNSGDDGGREERERLFRLHEEAVTFYQKLMNTPEGSVARDYIRKRKISPEMVAFYKVGYGGNGWSELSDYLKSKGYPDAQLLESGLCLQGRQGLIDRFRERLLFPILNREGRVCGFGGRILTDDKKTAKYLNSPETKVFHKGGSLYHFRQARDAILKSREAWVVEGYMDVIALRQNGIEHTVAPLGTALTEAQLSVLGRVAESIVFLFDGDAAGIKAAERSVELALNSDVKQWVAVLPDGKDPYDFAMESGGEALLEYVKSNRMAPLDFKIDKLWREAGNDREKFLKALFPTLAKLESPIRREEALRKASEKIGSELSVVKAEFGRRSDRSPQAPKPASAPVTAQKKDYPGLRLELDLAALLVLYPEIAVPVASILPPEEVRHPAVKTVYQAILDDPEREGQDWAGRIESEVLSRRLAEWLNRDHRKPLLAMETAYRLKLIVLKSKMAEMDTVIAQFERDGRQEDVARLMRDKMGLRDIQNSVNEALKEFEVDE